MITYRQKIHLSCCDIVTGPVLPAFLKATMSDNVRVIDVCVCDPTLAISLRFAVGTERGNAEHCVVTAPQFCFGILRLVRSLTAGKLHSDRDSEGRNITYTITTRQKRVPFALLYALTSALIIFIADCMFKSAF